MPARPRKTVKKVHPTKNPMMQTAVFGAVAGVVASVVIFMFLIFLMSKPQFTSKLLPKPTATPIPTVLPTDIPSSTPTPTAKPATKPSSENGSTGNNASCDQLRNDAPSNITVRLEPSSGQMTGNTVVRIKQGGNCPGGTGPQEKWLSEGEREAHFNGILPGTYIVEVANGNYQGIVRQTITIKGNGEYLFRVGIQG